MDPRYDYPQYRVPAARPPMPDPRSSPWGMGPDPGYVSRQPAYGPYPPMPPMPPAPPPDSFPGYGGGYPGPELYPMDSVYFSSGGYYGGDGATFAQPRPEPYRRPVGPVVIEHELRTVGSRKPTTQDADSTRKVSSTTTTDGAGRRNDGRYQTSSEVIRSSDSPSDVIRYPYQKKDDKVQLWREIGTKTIVDEPQRVQPPSRPVQQPPGPQLRQEYAMPPVGEGAYYRSDPWPYPMMYPAADRAYVPSGVPAYMMRR